MIVPGPSSSNVSALHASVASNRLLIKHLNHGLGHSINATVLGSKNAPEGTADNEAEKKDDEPEPGPEPQAKTGVVEEKAE